MHESMVAVVLYLLVGVISVYQLIYLLIHLNYGIQVLWRRRMAVIVQNSACTSGTLITGAAEASFLSSCSYKKCVLLTINYTALAHPTCTHGE